MTNAEVAERPASALVCSHAARAGSARLCPSCSRIERFKAQGRGQAGSIIVTVFGDGILPRGGGVWLGSLIALLAPLGLSERLVRTAVFRLAQDDWLQALVQGRRSDYRLTPAGRRRFVQASSQIYASASPPWDQRWRLITVTGALEPAARERLRRALFWHGFGELGGDCFVHPSADLALVFESLQADALAPLLGRLLPLVAANPQLSVSGKDADLVRRAWNLQDLDQAYRGFVDSYAPVLAQWQSQASALDEACAFLMRSLLIHDYRRLLLRDPQLPGVLLPEHWAGHDARQLCRQLYGLLLAPSERHLDRQLRLADGQVLLASALLGERFGLRDPLAGGV
ncbi:MAG: PaaX family transcriptional regulator C-terminal domain-containing protein [Betaproteobacteria bacterium]